MTEKIATHLLCACSACYGVCSQADEGMWRMPGHTEARKAAVSCEKLGGAAHTH